MLYFKNQITIIVDHSGFVAPRSDLVVFFHKGRIYKGRHEDLLKENLLYKNFLEGIKIEKDEI